MTDRDLIRCTEPDCECYPFVYFKCEYCNEVWVMNCRRGYWPKGSCDKCLEGELCLTSHVFGLATKLGIMEQDSEIWFRLFQNGLRRKLRSKAWIITVECRRLNKVPCSADTVKLPRWGIFKQGYAAWSWHETAEDYSCCQEDGLPRHWWQPSGHRGRQRNIGSGSNPDVPESSNVPQDLVRT